MQMQKITPWSWFQTQAVEAAKFYTSLLRGSSRRLREEVVVSSSTPRAGT